MVPERALEENNSGRVHTGHAVGRGLIKDSLSQVHDLNLVLVWHDSVEGDQR